VVESLKIITEKASTRISRFAFEYARKNKRKKIHSIHKANIMKLSDGLFLRCSRAISKEYPEITYGEHIVDNTCMQLVMNPYQYDMLLLENLLRRHYFRSVRRAGGRARPCPGSEFRARVRHFRSRTRLGA
jgi:isocitrate dehydrogenase (NAD+)